MRFTRSRLFMSGLFLMFFVATAVVILTDDVASSQAEERVEPHAETKAIEAEGSSGHPKGAVESPHEKAVAAVVTDPHACVAGAAALDDLSRQRDKLLAREKELGTKELEIKALEKAVKEEFAKLEQARTQFAKAEELKKSENEEKVLKIISTLETMSPKPASALLGTIDDALAITAMQRMDTGKLAKLLNVMEPGKSSRLTELLAGVSRAKLTELPSSLRNPASNGAAAGTNKVKKGGEK